MTDPRWARAKAIFLRCLSDRELEWDSILEQECRDDPELEREVRNLIAGHRMDSSVSTLTTDDAGGHLESLPHFGEYRVIERIGAGGFGEVYLAEQLDPRRRVALKLIRTGLSHREYRIRFEAERQALAIMSHPNVAQVFDAGTTRDSQLPFFVMEYVSGLPLTEHCDAFELGLRDRIELFVQVCAGVQHAHGKGVIHRDLKPANILVALDGDRPVPKIIDFGVAKAFGQLLTEETLHTDYGRIVGTLEYMSPEQAELGEDVDTRSDVYSLGVVLYELLVGEKPLDVARLRSSGLLAVQRAILDEEPLPPSVRASRAGERRRLRRELAGDLDWIVLRALEKDRNRRYATAAEFGSDLERHLRGEPVHASPPSARYRIGKFIRRNAGLVGASALVGIALIVAVIGLGWANLEIGRERDEAQDARDAARALARELLGLSDTKRLADALDAARELDSMTLEARPELEAWLKDHGLPLAERLVEHERVLSELRQRATRSSPVDAERHPRFEELALAQGRLKNLADARSKLESNEHDGNPPVGGADRVRETIQTESAQLLERIDRLREAIEGRRAYSFRSNDGSVDGDTQWEHDTREELVRRLHLFVSEDSIVPGLGNGLGSVRWRIAEIDRIERETLTSPEAVERWEQCRRDLASDDEVYRRLDLPPQFGLLPLDRNPSTRLWEFAHLPSGEAPLASVAAWDTSKGPSRWQLAPETGIVLVLIPGIRAPVGAQKPLLGISLDEASSVVRVVQEGSWAAKLDLRVGDHLVEVNETPIASSTDLRRALAPLRSGEELAATIEREGQRSRVAMVIPAGNYDPRAQANEGPVVEVRLDPYFIAKHEVTQAQWERLSGTNPSFINPIDHAWYASRTNPVEQVSWQEASRALSRVGLSLPTEAQWEVACRAGSDAPFGYGESLAPSQANIAGESYRKVYDQPGYGERDWDDGFGAHAPIGTFEPNRFGLHDMHGNVWEWCRDGMGPYTVEPRAGDGFRLHEGERGRVFRGGAFRDPAFIVRAAYRNQQLAEFRFNTIGLRAAAAIRR